MPALAPTADPPPPARPAAGKRQAILDAALRLIARSGLHDTPMSALAREAGVAAGTVYVYFPSKEALINALYLERLEDRHRATTAGVVPSAAWLGAGTAAPRDLLWRAWHGLARWHLDHPEASNLIQQCRATGILTAETRAAERQLEAESVALFDAVVARGLVRPATRQVFYALFAGPIAALVQMRDAAEIGVDDATLRATFEGVCRSVLPAAEAPGR